jgi:hypothetical protein
VTRSWCRILVSGKISHPVPPKSLPEASYPNIEARQREASRHGRFYPCFIGLVVFFLLAQPSLAQDVQTPAPENSSTQENAAAQNPPARVARISYLKGNVSFLRAGLDQWSQAALNFPATTGDRIYTDKGARAELEAGPYTVRLSEFTDLTITNLDDKTMQLGLSQGTLRVTVYQLPSDNTVEVDTSNGALTFLAPGKYRIDTDPDKNRTRASVNIGSLEVSGADVPQTVEAGQGV